MNEKNSLPAEGFVRIDQIVGKGNPIPISKSNWWAGVKSGKFPKPEEDDPLGPGITVWRVEKIRNLIYRGKDRSSCDKAE